VVTVSSGGMLVSPLDLHDLQAERGNFDGTIAYAGNKRQQVRGDKHGQEIEDKIGSWKINFYSAADWW
jgi:hypothetical protein